MGLGRGCLFLRSPFLHSWRHAVDCMFFSSRSPSFRDRTLHPVVFLCRVWRFRTPKLEPPGISGLSGASFFLVGRWAVSIRAPRGPFRELQVSAPGFWVQGPEYVYIYIDMYMQKGPTLGP